MFASYVDVYVESIEPVALSMEVGEWVKENLSEYDDVISPLYATDNFDAI